MEVCLWVKLSVSTIYLGRLNVTNKTNDNLTKTQTPTHISTKKLKQKQTNILQNTPTQTQIHVLEQQVANAEECARRSCQPLHW